MTVGDKVLIRSGPSGVWMGKVKATSDMSVTIKGRRLWQWKGALDCSTLAVSGPKEGSRISAPTLVELPLAGIVESHSTTKAARQALKVIEVAS